MIYKKDLVDVADKDYKDRQNEYMLCSNCSESFGGTRGDYFMMPDDVAFTCPECGNKDIKLVEDIIIQKIIKQ